MNIYILKLEKEKYYVGKTTKLPIDRVLNHFEGKGSAWTKCYKPIDVIEIHSDCDAFDEDKYTKILMAKYGIENVRGGVYSQITLSQEQISLLTAEFNHAKDKCLSCGKNGHFINNCPKLQYYKKQKHKLNVKEEYSPSQNVCEVDTNTPKKQPQKSLISRAWEYFEKQMCDTIEKTTEKCKRCKRCGRESHDRKHCYAKIDINGNIICDKIVCFKCGNKGHYADMCYF